jgi:hypothetical protein
MIKREACLAPIKTENTLHRPIGIQLTNNAIENFGIREKIMKWYVYNVY